MTPAMFLQHGESAHGLKKTSLVPVLQSTHQAWVWIHWWTGFINIQKLAKASVWGQNNESWKCWSKSNEVKLLLFHKIILLGLIIPVGNSGIPGFYLGPDVGHFIYSDQRFPYSLLVGKVEPFQRSADHELDSMFDWQPTFTRPHSNLRTRFCYST